MSLPDFTDDPSIADIERLLRRIHLKQIVKDEDTGLARISSGAFRDKELSVDIEKVLRGRGQEIDFCLKGQRACKLAYFTAGSARQFQQVVFHDPMPDDPAHGIVYGSKNNRRICEGLRDSAIWAIPAQAPPFADIEAEGRELGLVL
jgi:hypothetical protein